MLFSTNKIQPKENRRLNRYLEEEKDKNGNPTGNVISSIPRDVFTTSQERVKGRPTGALPRRFPGVRIVEQKKPGVAFMQTSDLEDMRRKAENEKRRALMMKKAAVEPGVTTFPGAPPEKTKAKRGGAKKR